MSALPGGLKPTGRRYWYYSLHKILWKRLSRPGFHRASIYFRATPAETRSCRRNRRQETTAPGPATAPDGTLPRIIMPRTSSFVTSSVRAWPTTLPFFMTNTRSARSKTSWISWLMRKMPMPCRFSSLTRSPTCAVSCGPSAAVGSSMMRMRASNRMARAIATTAAGHPKVPSPAP